MIELLLACVLASKVPEAPLAGTVRAAESGAVLAGALVEVTDVAAQVWSDTSGAYSIDPGQPGLHHVRVSRAGYRTRMLDVVTSVDVALHVDVMLEAEPQPLPAISIRARRAMTDPVAGASTVADETDGRNLDARGIRTSAGLLDADPLRALGALANVSAPPEGAASLHVRGGSSDQNLMLVDGLPVYNSQHTAATLTALNPDVVSTVTIRAGVPSAQYGGALSSVIAIRTDTSGTAHLTARGGVNPSAVRQLVAMPLPWPGGSLLVSARRSVADIYGGLAGQPSTAELFWDGFARAITPLWRGELELFGLRSHDRFDFDAKVDVPAGAPVSASEGKPRNSFRWASHTAGAVWARGESSGTRAIVRAWRTEFAGGANWARTSRTAHLGSARASTGANAQLSVTRARTRLSAGASMEWIRDEYEIGRTCHAGTKVTTSELGLATSLPAASLFAEGRWTPAKQWTVVSGLREPLGGGSPQTLEPRLTARYSPREGLGFFVGYSRTHQQSQSLRNEESLIDALVGIALPTTGPRAARSDQLTASIDARLPDGFELTIDGYHRVLERLLLVAPRTAQPFATDGFTTGRGRATGLGLSLGRRGELWDFAGAYTLAKTTRTATGQRYRPSFGAAQSLTAAAAVRVHPATTVSVNLWGVSGRPMTLTRGEFEWEHAALLGGVGEVAGSPQQFVGALGGAHLPAYWRLDLGMRHEWRICARTERCTLGGTVAIANIFGQRGAIGAVVASDGFSRRAIVQSPRALRVGLDWSL
ncbi:MAG: TonB-dependent receptor [Gemmatimonadaceae bacterium]|nr:TonB-dependent receptor [Gemmatimonadaceae bacterium]